MFTQYGKVSRPDVSGITYKHLRSAQYRAMKQGHHYQIPSTVLAAIGVAIAAVEFYQVRELLAELLIFSVLFIAMGMALLILFLIQEVALKGMARLEARMAYVHAWRSGASGMPAKYHVLRSSRWI